MKLLLNLSIKTQLLFLLISISLFLIITISYFSVYQNIKSQKEMFLDNTDELANVLAQESIQTLAFFDKEGALENIEKLKIDKTILKIIIYDNEKNIFASYNPINKKNTHKKNESEVSFTDSQNKDIFDFGSASVLKKIVYNNQNYGYLYLEKSATKISKSIKNTIINILLFVLIITIFIYYISVITSKILLKPILHLSNISHEVSNTQDYSIRVNHQSNNEISTLYSSFNKLLIVTQNLTNNLEEQVGSRTNDLHEKTLLLENNYKELKDTQSQLIESEKMSALGSLVGGVAHEVNTPVGNAIIGSSVISNEIALLLKDLNNNTLKKSSLEQRVHIINDSSVLIQKSLKYASNLIKSFKQIAIDQTIEDLRLINLKDYIEEVLFTNNNKLKRVPVKVNLHCDDKININTYPGFISQILNNFINNSILHGFEEKKGNEEINILVTDNKKFLKINYRDNGSGLKEGIKGNIFEPFVTSKKNKGGTGLGLSIVYNLVIQKLKGEIEYKHNIKNGFEISFTILKDLETQDKA